MAVTDASTSGCTVVAACGFWAVVANEVLGESSLSSFADGVEEWPNLWGKGGQSAAGGHVRALHLVVIARTAFHCAPSWSGEVTGEAPIKVDVTRLLLLYLLPCRPLGTCNRWPVSSWCAPSKALLCNSTAVPLPLVSFSLSSPLSRYRFTTGRTP